MWDLHYTPLNIPPSYPIAATYHQTAPDPTSPWVMPGTYTVTLTVNGRAYTQPLVVVMDPRVKTPAAALKQQHDLSLMAYEGRKQVLAMQQEGQQLKGKAKTDDQKKAFDASQASLNNLNRAFMSLFGVLQDTDMPPTTQAITAAVHAQATLAEVTRAWKVQASR